MFDDDGFPMGHARLGTMGRCIWGSFWAVLRGIYIIPAPFLQCALRGPHGVLLLTVNLQDYTTPQRLGVERPSTQTPPNCSVWHSGHCRLDWSKRGVGSLPWQCWPAAPPQRPGSSHKSSTQVPGSVIYVPILL